MTYWWPCYILLSVNPIGYFFQLKLRTSIFAKKNRWDEKEEESTYLEWFLYQMIKTFYKWFIQYLVTHLP